MQVVPKRAPALPDLVALHERHHGITQEVGAYYAQAASVALDRHHTSPVDIEITSDEGECVRELRWTASIARHRGAWANADDTTAAAAYIISLAVVETEMGLVAVQRAENRTGCDYYVAEPSAVDPDEDTVDLERAFRLEVSGSDHGNHADVRRRLREKAEQTRRGASNLPAIAAVVGFKLCVVNVQSVAADDDENA